MDETAHAFFKPRCPVAIGDVFYRNYRVPNTMLQYEVTDIREAEDENGIYYAVTAKCDNITVGQNTKVYSSRYLTNGDYTFVRQRGRYVV